MPIVTSYPPGAPCWFELGTSDQTAAKAFYSSLLGWTISDSPMGPGQVYTIFNLDGKNAAAAYTLGPELKGVPPNWMVYFSTPDADAAAAKVTALGGAIKMGPFDVMEHGRMAVCADPTGAVFSLWQAKKHSGAAVVGELNSVCWSELATRDLPKAREFYTALLGWETYESTSGPGYTHIKVAGQDQGGMIEMDAQWEGIPPHWGIYFLVDDCDGVATKIKELGGRIRHGPFDAPNVGRIAMAADGQGAGFSIIKLTGMAA